MLKRLICVFAVLLSAYFVNSQTHIVVYENPSTTNGHIKKVHFATATPTAPKEAKWTLEMFYQNNYGGASNTKSLNIF